MAKRIIEKTTKIGVHDFYRGDIIWTIELNGKEVLHREDGPAYILENSNNIRIECYWLNGKRHKEDGPAVIYLHNNKIIKSQYWINNFFIVEIIGKQRKINKLKIFKRELEEWRMKELWG